jgi:hypothetical protein
MNDTCSRTIILVVAAGSVVMFAQFVVGTAEKALGADSRLRRRDSERVSPDARGTKLHCRVTDLDEGLRR